MVATLFIRRTEFIETFDLRNVIKGVIVFPFLSLYLSLSLSLALSLSIIIKQPFYEHSVLTRLI